MPDIQIGEDAMTWIRRGTFALAVLAVVFSVYGRRLGLLEFQPGGASFDSIIRPIFLWIFIAGLVAALRWEIVGGIIAGLAAAGVVAFATNQLVASDAALVVAAFAVPALLWIFIDIHDMSPRGAALSMFMAIAVAVCGFLLGDYAYERVWGPTHPDSAVEPLDDSPVEWIWSGGVDTRSASVRFKSDMPFESARLAVATDASLAGPVWFDLAERSGSVGAFVLEGLDPDTRYHYAVEVDGVLDMTRAGRFRTFPERASSFQVAFGACARVGSNGRVFDTVRSFDPLLYLILGDFHYGDNEADDVDDYRDVLDLTLTRPGQAALYRTAPVAYVWDDHDYGPNDSDGSSLARAAAMASYREYVPSYALAGPESPVYQAFTIGRVRFILTDDRAGRTPKDQPDDADKTMLGEEQKAWFKDEVVRAASSHELVVWVNPVPWVAEARQGADDWGGYSTERRELADHLVAHEIDNLVMVSGDAHMVAIDDGTNTNFSSTPGTAFPLLHVAALDRPGGVKGGPYSEGAIGGGGQFATMDVHDDGAIVRVTLAAWSWQGEQLLRHEFNVD